MDQYKKFLAGIRNFWRILYGENGNFCPELTQKLKKLTLRQKNDFGVLFSIRIACVIFSFCLVSYAF